MDVLITLFKEAFMKFIITLAIVSLFAVACNKDSNQSSGGGTGMQKEQQSEQSGSASDANTQPTQNSGTQQ
jgi:hypothetical protein